MLRCQFSLIFVAAISSACGLNTDGIDTATPSTSEPSDTTSITDADPPTGGSTSEGQPVISCVDDTGSIPDGFLAAPYSYALSVAGIAPPYVWDAANLPEGLSLAPDPDNPDDTTKAVIVGTPSVAGDFAVEITVTDTNDSSNFVNCGLLRIGVPIQVDHATLFNDVGGCIPVGDDNYDSLADLFDRGILAGDHDFSEITCEHKAERGHGSGDFDKDSNTPDTMPPGITLDSDTCTTSGAINSTLEYGIYGFLTTFNQVTSASAFSTHVPYCAANMAQAPTAYGVMREDSGNVATFLPGIQQLSPGEAVSYGIDVPDPRVTVDYGMPCMGGSCFYAFVFSYNTLSSDAMVSANPNAKFPAEGFEGFTHGIRFDDADEELLDRFAGRAWVVNITFDYCIADNSSDCGNDEPDFAKRAEKIRQNGNGSNYYFSLVLLPET